MRCLHIIAGDLWAGAEVSAFHLMTELARRPDIEIQAALFCEGEMADRLRDRAIPVHVLPEHRLSFPRLALAAVRSVRDRPPEIIHSHKTREHLIGSLIASRLGGAHVRSVHGLPPRLSSTRSLLAWADMLDDALANFSESTWIAVTPELAGQVAGIRRTVHVVPNGLPAHPAEATPSALDEAFGSSIRGRYVGFVGRLEAVKRPDRFVRVMAQVFGDLSARDVRGVLVGDGSMRESVDRAINARGLADRIRMLGHRADAPAIVGALNALVICSDHEGHPMVLLEAMRAGVPIVAFDVGGLRDALGDAPWLVPAGDEDAMAVAIAKLLSDRAQAQSWSEALKRSFLERYTVERAADRVLSIYEELT